MPTAAPTITDARFNALKAKLRELFELDKSDLDFGIYRIMAAKNAEITDFLDHQLKDVVRETLTQHGADATDQVQAELDKAIEQARDLGADPDSVPKVQQLRARLDAAGGAAGADLEADIYNHLLAFFSRYYDEGDFISKRRYKGDTYAIPYSGEEVVLHWANKDQYYIKSGEWHRDYRFRFPAAGNGKTVRFKLIEATQEAANNKEPDESKRRYILDHDNPIEATDAELTLRFQFRAPTEAEKTAVEESEATRVFGGKYDKPTGRTKGDEREQFCADAERRALDAMPEEWKRLVSAASATDAKPNRTIIGKHLDEFTARNTFDYFIHKDLGGFLRRELDFYIKNEVVRLDDVEALDDAHLAQVQSKIKAIRRVAGRIIDFLAAIENFQKKMWLKKKLVLEMNWLVTIDRVPADLRDVVAANEAQWTEWESLGFKPADDNGDGELFGGAEWGTREYLDACDKLVVDTRLFDRAFTAALLASEEVLGDHPSLDEATTGVLVNGDNFQATSALAARYRAQVKCVYLDPPYNTSEETFVYKNLYRHSSWGAMLHDRLHATLPLMAESACLQLAIDDAEYHRAKGIVDIVFGEENYIGTIAVQSNPRGRGINTHYATSHDYLICSGRNEQAIRVVDQPLTEDQEASYSGCDDESAFRLLPFRRSGGLSTPVDRPNSEFSLLIEASSKSVVGVGGPRRAPYPEPYSSDDAYVLGTDGAIERVEYAEAVAKEGIVEVMPTDSSGGRRVWRWSDRTKIMEHAAKGDFVVRGDDGDYSVLLKDRIKPGRKPKTMWYESKYDASSHGTNLIKEIMGGRGQFGYPKSLYNTYDAIHSIVGDDPEAVILDYFGGSGTTAHAVIMLNRADDEGGYRRFLLVEMGAYFHTVLKPRVAKLIYSPEWKDGLARLHGQGSSALVKYFSLEAYEDALNNLPSPSPVGDLLANTDGAVHDSMLTYALDLELGPHLLNLHAFRDPWTYTINAQLASEDEIKPHRVDLVESFNYLIGLKVRSYGPIEQYSAEFERADHDDDLGRLKLTGRLRRDQGGPYRFQRVEGELNDGNDTRVLVVWRTLTDDPEKDAAVLEAWMERHREDTRQRSEHRDYHLIWINGPVTLPQPTAEIRTVFPIEETFKAKMFEDSDAAGGS